MKFLVTFFLLLAGGNFAFATTTHDTIHEQLTRSVAQQQISPAGFSNEGAIEKNHRITFTAFDGRFVQEDHNFAPMEQATIYCKAYALDAHWTLVAAPCAHAFAFNGWKKNIPYAQQIYSVSMHTNNFENWDSIFQDDTNYFLGWISKNGQLPHEDTHMAYNNHIMLIWHEQRLYEGPYVNVLATTSPEQLFALETNNTFKINTARYMFFSDSIRERSLQKGSVKGNTFRLDESATDLSGTSTDPLFLITPQHTEFIAGYNAAKLGKKWFRAQWLSGEKSLEGLACPVWYSLTKNDLQFIEQTVRAYRPQDWFSIKGRLFFNQTQTPFFK
ncbi:hypothetical protein [Candidatus Avelusimicrobium luingense]|uniref:hypothetical protein n=1 Tax=Candidatus Avelusimicrobium luingense TaxID=3416211 RepID=UPI003D10A183